MAAVKIHEKQLLQEIALIPGVLEVRGAGLLIGIELTKPLAAEVLLSMRESGVLVNAATATTIRIAPALNVSTSQINSFISIFRKAVTHVNS